MTSGHLGEASALSAVAILPTYSLYMAITMGLSPSR